MHHTDTHSTDIHTTDIQSKHSFNMQLYTCIYTNKYTVHGTNVYSTKPRNSIHYTKILCFTQYELKHFCNTCWIMNMNTILTLRSLLWLIINNFMYNNVKNNFVYFSASVSLSVYRCFIPNVYTALCTAAFIPLSCVVGVLVVFIHAYHVTQQWKAYDDVYRGRTNSSGDYGHTHSPATLLGTPVLLLIHAGIQSDLFFIHICLNVYINMYCIWYKNWYCNKWYLT